MFRILILSLCFTLTAQANPTTDVYCNQPGIAPELSYQIFLVREGNVLTATWTKSNLEGTRLERQEVVKFAPVVSDGKDVLTYESASKNVRFDVFLGKPLPNKYFRSLLIGLDSRNELVRERISCRVFRNPLEPTSKWK